MEPLHINTRTRVQKLIRMGEFLEQYEPALVMAIEQLDDAHDHLMNTEELNHEELAALADKIFVRQYQPMRLLVQIMAKLTSEDTWVEERGGDVTLFHPFASKEYRHQVVIEAPKDLKATEDQIKNLPTAKKPNA